MSKSWAVWTVVLKVTLLCLYVTFFMRAKAQEPPKNTTFLWPIPHSMSFGLETSRLQVPHDVNFQMLGKIDHAIHKILVAAVHRMKLHVFPHPVEKHRHHRRLLEERDGANSTTGNHVLSQGATSSAGAVLKAFIVDITSPSDELQLGTNESYELVVPLDGTPVILKAETVFGALHGLETFSQLCIFNYDTETVEISKVPWHIKDEPRFKHRGILIDTSRHYEPIPFLKSVVNSMTYAKLNVLHWHIVDDQSFPVQNSNFPNLWRGAHSKQERYTLNDVRELVEYARIRGVKVMAELDMPGHAQSWGIGYPDLWPSDSCRHPLDISKNATFDVIDGLLKEFSKIFPYNLLHLGGDEVATDCWGSTPHISKWMDEHGLDERSAFKYFLLKVQNIALSYGVTPVNWEETYDMFGTQLNNATIIQNWLVPGKARVIAASGYNCIVSNNNAWYLDHLDRHWTAFYENEPMEGIQDGDELAARVLGGEVCMWGENVDPSNLLSTIWPRAAAAAERLWSPRNTTDSMETSVALTRLEHFRCLLHKRHIPAGPIERNGLHDPASCYNQ